MPYKKKVLLGIIGLLILSASALIAPVALAEGDICGDVVFYQLTAEPNQNIGGVAIWNNTVNTFVRYFTFDSSWLIQQVQLNINGNLYSQVTGGVTDYTQTLALPAAGGTTVSVVGSVLVTNNSQYVNAWVGFTQGNPISYTVKSCEGEPPPPPPPPPAPGGTQGCTPGYWRQPHHYDSWVGYSPSARYSDVFGVGPAMTLGNAVKANGGGENALLRHSVAALLNASSSVDYQYNVAQVISQVQAAYASGSFEATKNVFEAQNEKGCPLN